MVSDAVGVDASDVVSHRVVDRRAAYEREVEPWNAGVDALTIGPFDVPSDRRTPARRPAQNNGQRPAHAADPSVAIKRRRTNVLFMLVIATACTMFLAFTTASGAMQTLFAVSFLGLCGYVYLLAQLREREDASFNNGWLEQH